VGDAQASSGERRDSIFMDRQIQLEIVVVCGYEASSGAVEVGMEVSLVEEVVGWRILERLDVIWRVHFV
jgi:hypothetical protein